MNYPFSYLWKGSFPGYNIQLFQLEILFFLKNDILFILISYYIRLNLNIIVSNPSIQALLFNINKHLLRVWKMHLFMVQYYKRVTILVFTKFFYQARFLYWYWFLLITRHISVSMDFCKLKIAIQAKSLFSKEHHKVLDTFWYFVTILFFYLS